PLFEKIIQYKTSKTIILTGKNITNDKKRAVKKLGVTVISQTEEKLCLQSVLHHLGTLHIMSVLVEGGAQIHASFIEANAFQQIIAYVAPKVIGGKEAISFIGGNGTSDVISGKTLHFTEIKQIGPDIKIIATCNKEEEGVLCLQE